ncbi:hypothetical protein HNQ44_001493 [Planomicrobium koreense]|uniref:Uncharacterized protein n=1 Tax=Planococcus koreensis TaxID=112331 RepID=A0A7W8FS12_9BACL|nr:hypothetical protein [Planococcus koreensis]MBB5180069.1 hypothetical protein [Planococcus koreensis]
MAQVTHRLPQVKMDAASNKRFAASKQAFAASNTQVSASDFKMAQVKAAKTRPKDHRAISSPLFCFLSPL